MRSRTLLMTFLAVLSLTACRLGGRWSVQGYVYDVISGQRLTTYTLEVNIGGAITKAKVAADGQYKVDLSPDNDYTVTVKSAGYRDFISRNGAIFDSGSDTNEPRALFRDAVLIPNDPAAPATTFELRFTDKDGRPQTAQLQLRLTALPDLPDDGTGATRWVDTDALAKGTVLLDAENGLVRVDAGTLIYGATYTGRVIGVEGYEIATTGDIVAGNNSYVVLGLAPYDAGFQLGIVATNVQFGDLVADGKGVIVFNAPIELDPSFTDAFYKEMLDQGFRISLEDNDYTRTQPQQTCPMMPNPGNPPPVNVPAPSCLKSAGSSGSQTTANFAINGDTMTFTWTESLAFEVNPPANNPVATIFYPLGNLRVRAADRPDSHGVAISSLQVVNGAMATPASLGIITVNGGQAGTYLRVPIKVINAP